MQKRFCITNNRVVEVQDDTAPIIVYINPDEAERRHLIDVLKIDEHTLQSALDPDELSRLEFEPEHTAMIFKRPKNYSSQVQFLFKVTSAGLFLFKDCLIVILPEEAALFDNPALVRVGSLPGVVLKLLLRSIVHFREHLKGISMISDELQSAISRAMENRHLLNLFTLQKSLVYYLNFINSNGVLIERLRANAPRIGFSVDELEMLDDILIENNQCYKQAEIYSNVLASLMDARASIVSNNLNVLMMTLNIITIAIMVPTLVVSIFSMNVPLPFQEHDLAFWIVMILAVCSVVGTLAAFWRFRRR